MRPSVRRRISGPSARGQGIAAGIELLIGVRNTAKQQKNFAEADRVRQVLLDKGIVLEDGPGGTTWRRR